jgi:transposase-like protein
MERKTGGIKPAIRYSEAFKIGVVRELEREGLLFDHVRRKYGIGGSFTVQKWVKKYGNGTRGKMIRVQKRDEIDQMKQLKERIRKLETALADAHVDLSLERAYMRIACGRAGITDIEEFKKKNDGKPGTER